MRGEFKVRHYPASRYTVIRNGMPDARVIRMTAAELGLPFSDSAL